MYYKIAPHTSLQPCMFGRNRQQKGWEHDGCANSAHLLVVISAGEAVFRFCGNTVRAVRGDALFIPETVKYRAHAEEYVEYVFLQFRADLLPAAPIAGAVRISPSSPTFATDAFSYVSIGNATTDAACITLGDHVDCLAVLPQILDAYDRCLAHVRDLSETEVYPLLIAEYSKILWLCARGARSRAIPDALAAILTHVEKHYDAPLTLSSIAEQFFLSRSYVARMFRTHFHTTFGRYLSEIRLRRALFLVSRTAMPIAEIAAACGFSDRYYFSRAFKAYFHKTPGEVRSE